MDEDLPAFGPGVARCLDQGFIDAQHRIEDRHDHERGEQVDEGDSDGEIGIEQPFDRLTDQAEPEECLVHQAVAAEERNQEIIRITSEVQNGMMHTSASTSCMVSVRM